MYIPIPYKIIVGSESLPGLVFGWSATQAYFPRVVAISFVLSCALIIWSGSWVRQRLWFDCLPQSESSPKRIAVVARTALRRQLLQFLHVAASEHDFVGFQSGDQASDDVCDMAAPLLLPFL